MIDPYRILFYSKTVEKGKMREHSEVSKAYQDLPLSSLSFRDALLWTFLSFLLPFCCNHNSLLVFFFRGFVIQKHLFFYSLVLITMVPSVYCCLRHDITCSWFAEIKQDHGKNDEQRKAKLQMREFYSFWHALWWMRGRWGRCARCFIFVI